MYEQFSEWLERINWFLVTQTPAQAIILGLLCSWGLTQFIKFAPPVRHLPEEVNKFVVQSVALIGGFVPTYLQWPSDDTNVRWIGASLVGLSSPYLYKRATILLYLWWPSIEQKVSGTPRVSEPATTIPSDQQLVVIPEQEVENER